jgi:hypothetical protein
VLGWWRGDGTAADSWGLNNGRWLGEPAYAPGRVGQALALRGGNAVGLGHDSTLLSGAGLGFAAWVSPEPGAEGALVSKYDPASGRGWQLRSLGGRLWFCAGPGHPGPCGGSVSQRLETGVALKPGQWTHIAVNASGERVELYLNGRRAAAGEVDLRFLEAVPADLVLGGPGWRGLLDEAIYATHLDTAALKALIAMPACVVGR